MNESGFDTEILSRAHEVVQVRYPQDALPAMKSLLWEHTRQKNLETLDTQKLAQFKNTPIFIDASLYDNYRQYYDHPEVEFGEPLIPLSKYGIKSQDAYYKYSKSTLDDVIKREKSGTILTPDVQKIPQLLTEDDGKLLQFDDFYKVSENEQLRVLKSIGSKLGYNLREPLTIDDIQRTHRTFSLHFGNQKLKHVVPKDGENQVREEIGRALQEINQKLKPLGYSLGVDTGYRSAEEQKVIKINHARTYGKTVADSLYSDKSPHSTGGAMDMLLFDATGKQVNMKIGDNSLKTKELLHGEELLKSGKPTSLDEQKVIEARRILFHVMTSNGFIPLITEYWHFGWGDRLSRYIESKKSGTVFPAQYGNI